MNTTCTSSSPSPLLFQSNEQKLQLIQRIESYLTSRYSVSCGRDTHDNEYDSIIDFWQDRGLLTYNYRNSNNPHDSESDENQPCNNTRTHDNWYKKSHEYWQDETNVEPTIDGMLGGFSVLSERDLVASRKFMDVILKSRCRGIITSNSDRTESKTALYDKDGNLITDTEKISSNVSVQSRSCECGAGIGRITKGLLLPFGISSCDLIETSPRLIQHAPQYIGEKDVLKCNFICQGLQDFQPDPHSYDIIWIQWVIGYLTDWDLVSFLNRMGKALRPGGVIVVKDNCCNDMAFLADCNDSDITRSFQYLMAIVKESGLKVVYGESEKLIRWQDDFPDDIWPVPMIALEYDEPGDNYNCKR